MADENNLSDSDTEWTGVRVVAMHCVIDQLADYYKRLWYNMDVDSEDDVFMEDVAALPSLLEIPIVVQRIGTISSEQWHLDNQPVTWMMIDPEIGFAPPEWQHSIGTVVVARKDKKPFLVEHMECLHEYNSAILDCFGEGNGPPKHMYNRQAFEKFWAEYKAKRADQPDWKHVKSPYEV